MKLLDILPQAVTDRLGVLGRPAICEGIAVNDDGYRPPNVVVSLVATAPKTPVDVLAEVDRELETVVRRAIGETVSDDASRLVDVIVNWRTAN